jgi:DNA-binding IclR family transcriptional regulator
LSGVPSSLPDADGRSSLGRADAILSAFDELHPSLSLTGITARTGLPKTTVYRAVERMLQLGWLEHNGTRYSIGSRLFEMASLTRLRMQLRECALPFLEDLHEATHETVHLAVLDELAVLYVDKISRHGRTTDLTRVGGRMPAYCTGVGKALLAHARPEITEAVVASGLAARTPATIADPARFAAELAVVRDAGVAFDREECAIGLACIAAPVFAPDGECLAALSVTGPAETLPLDRLAPAVRAAGLGISRALRDLGRERR